MLVPVLISLCLIYNAGSTPTTNTKYETNEAVNNLREYLRIRTVQPNVDYDECINFLKRQADSIGLPYKVYEVKPRKPIIVMSWTGTEPTLPAILLNSHMDVVPVFEESWTYPPFDAHIDSEGIIYARGIQDMKSVGIQYIEAIRRLKASGFTPKRTIHLSFVPDEEIGGLNGMDLFVKTKDFKSLNIGFSLDEGITSATEEYLVFYAERSLWHLEVVVSGKSGHGSLLHENTAGEKLRYVLNKFLDLREVYKTQYEQNKSMTIDECINFLKRQADSIGLPYKVYEVKPRKPIIVMTWTGTEPTLPAILLNSHMDVVPVFEESWTYPPFDAHIDSEGIIYARGIQDMKSVGIQYIEAIRRLKASGFTPKRTIHLSFVPDEEIGGLNGMDLFVKTKDFKSLNIGFSLDEGITSATEEYLVFYAERSLWHLEVVVSGKSGHGSLLHENTAGEKLRYVLNKFLDLREVYKTQYEQNKSMTIGDVTTINLTQLKGGLQANIVPETFTAIFDIRLAINVNHDEFENMFKKWFEEVCGDGITYSFIQKEPFVAPTKIDDSNVYWLAFKNTLDAMKMKYSTRVFPGATDSRFIRQLGIPALGFSPIINTEVMLHETNEKLSADVFLKGIDIYKNIISALSTA